MAEDLKKFAPWEKTRAKGRSHFIWFNGVLLWGVMTGVAWSAVMPIMNPEMHFLSLLPIALIGFPIGGFVFGVVMWSMMEKKYQKALAESAR